MKLFLDTAEYDEVKTGVEWGVIDGVTTNPTLIAKAGQDHETQVKKICGIIGNVLSIESACPSMVPSLIDFLTKACLGLKRCE